MRAIQPVVLVIGDHDDWSGQAVATELTGLGARVVRLDTVDFPQHARLTARFSDGWEGLLTMRSARLELGEVAAVYYRKPRMFDMPTGMSEPERRFARAQARAGVGGVLASLPVKWINHPSALADSEGYKPRQLAMAAACGFTVPETIVTNDPDEVRAFAARMGSVVVKPLAEPLVWEASGTSVVYTHRLTTDDFADLDGVRTTAHLFQQWIQPAYAMRVTAVGDRLFPVAIFPGSEEAVVDWRADYSALHYEVIDIPQALADAIRRYLDVAGLTFGAFDFLAVAGSEELFFLECNGSGQWGWLAEACDVPIARALAEELMGGH